MNHTNARGRLPCGCCALLLIAAIGCRNLTDALSLHRFKSRGDLALADPPDDPPSSDKKSPSAAATAPGEESKSAPKAAASAAPSPGAADGSPALDDAFRAALAKDAWTAGPAIPGIQADKSGWRYRNPALEELARLPAEERPPLDAQVDAKNPIVAVNAAIVQLRWGRAEPVERLAATVRRGELRPQVRLAAIEALGSIPSPEARAAIESLLKRYGDPTGSSAAQYVPRLHGDLLAALARSDPAAARPYWAAGLKSPDADVRMVTLDLLSECDAPLPANAAGLREDNDPRIRAAALRALARRHDPRAFDYLKRGLDDYDLSVRLEAIRGLGEVRTPQSRAALEKMMSQPGELVRSAIVGSLSALDADDAVAAAASDKSSRVRQAVATALARPDGLLARRPREAAQLVSTLVSDRTPDVQRDAVLAVAAWPLEQAGPILLEAMRERGYLVRKTAANQLSQRWPEAGDFPPDSSEDQRAAALEKLRVAWISQFGPQGSFEPRAPAEPPGVTLRRIELQWRDVARRTKLEDQVNPVAWVRDALGQEASARHAALEAPADAGEETRALVAKLSGPSLTTRDRDAVIESLKGQGAAILPVLDEIAVVDSQPLPEAIYTDVLPPFQPAFALLLEMQTAKPIDRWSVVERLRVYTAHHPLPALALSRLADIMAHEKDTLVWQTVLTAVIEDGREPADRIAAMGIGHASPEARRRACEYFARHANPKHAALLLPLLADSQTTVVIAAVKGLGMSGPLDDVAPLAAMLTRPEKPLRIETALALARLKDPQGPVALERLAGDVDVDVRRGAAMAMGVLEDDAYAPRLIELLDDRNDVAEAAMKSLVKTVGRDVAADPAEPAPTGVAEKIQRWQRWQRQRTAKPAAPADS